MPTPAVSVSHFSKRFGSADAVSNLSFEVQKGEVFAFLGSNGSGKTTTIRALLGIYAPTSGELLISGRPYQPEMSAMLGYLPEERGLYATAKVLETMVYLGEMKGLTAPEAAKRAREFLERVGLADKADTVLKRLSGGQQQKVQLGATIINQPELLILDEPTKGLDPVNRSLLMELLQEMNKAGSTIIFITHQMDEVEKVADRLVLIKDGKRLLYGGVEEVKRQFGSGNLLVRFEGELPQSAKLFTAQLDRHSATLRPAEGVSAQQVLKFLVEKGAALTEFRVDAPTLNDIFIRSYRGEVPEEGK